MERTPNKSAHKVNTGEENSPAAVPGFELATFRSEYSALTNKLSRPRTG